MLSLKFYKSNQFNKQMSRTQDISNSKKSQSIKGISKNHLFVPLFERGGRGRIPVFRDALKNESKSKGDGFKTIRNQSFYIVNDVNSIGNQSIHIGNDVKTLWKQSIRIRNDVKTIRNESIHIVNDVKTLWNGFIHYRKLAIAIKYLFTGTCIYSLCAGKNKLPMITKLVLGFMFSNYSLLNHFNHD